MSLMSPALAGRFFASSATSEAPFKEVIRVKSGHTGGALTSMRGVFIRRESDIRDWGMQRKAQVKTHIKGSYLQAKREERPRETPRMPAP